MINKDRHLDRRILTGSPRYADYGSSGRNKDKHEKFRPRKQTSTYVNGNATAGNTTSGEPPIVYQIGKPVMTNPIKIFRKFHYKKECLMSIDIFYGSWTESRKSLVNAFASGLGTSNWYKTNLKYYFQPKIGGAKTYVRNQVYLYGSFMDNYSQGNNVKSVWEIIRAKIDSGAIPTDGSAVYAVMVKLFLLTIKDISRRHCWRIL